MRFWLTIIYLWSTFPTFCDAHDQAVHQAIADSAARSSSGLSNFLTDNLGTQFTPFITSPELLFSNPDGITSNGPVQWIELGAYHEDDHTRPVDHFYTVTPSRVASQVYGLTDWHESIILPRTTLPNSFAWGTSPGLQSPFIFRYSSSATNTETWGCARGYELAALTNANQIDRDANMAHMLYSLGHILHLNEDLSQPDHVRNENQKGVLTFDTSFGNWVADGRRGR